MLPLNLSIFFFLITLKLEKKEIIFKNMMSKKKRLQLKLTKIIFYFARKKNAVRNRSNLK